MTEQELENFYREHLEEDIIFCLSNRQNISLEKAMEIYYSSKLSEKVYAGLHGVQYLDASILADLLAAE